MWGLGLEVQASWQSLLPVPAFPTESCVQGGKKGMLNSWPVASNKGLLHSPLDCGASCVFHHPGPTAHADSFMGSLRICVLDS